MYLDGKLQFSDSQALTGTSLVRATDCVDVSAARTAHGVGEPLALVVISEAAMGGTSPTITIALRTDDNASMSSATTMLTTAAIAGASFGVGAKIVIPLANTNERYLEPAYTMGGTSPTATVSAYLQPLSMIQNNANYPDSISFID